MPETTTLIAEFNEAVDADTLTPELLSIKIDLPAGVAIDEKNTPLTSLSLKNLLRLSYASALDRNDLLLFFVHDQRLRGYPEIYNAVKELLNKPEDAVAAVRHVASCYLAGALIFKEFATKLANESVLNCKAQFSTLTYIGLYPNGFTYTLPIIAKGKSEYIFGMDLVFKSPIKPEFGLGAVYVSRVVYQDPEDENNDRIIADNCTVRNGIDAILSHLHELI